MKMNSDDLARAEQYDLALIDDVIDPRLTDAYADGGLFGFDFEYTTQRQRTGTRKRGIRSAKTESNSFCRGIREVEDALPWSQCGSGPRVPGSD